MEENIIKIVLDTNIFISSVFWEKGNPHKIIEKAIEGKINVFTSEEILEELKRVLKRDFDESEDFIQEQINLIKEYSEIIEIKERVDVVKEDPDDNKIIECALASNADYIVTGDNHLLKMQEYKNTKIINPQQLIEMIYKLEL